MNFKKEVALGIPKQLPNKKIYDPNVNHAPIRENVLTREEKILALRNALRYFDKKFHKELIPEFKSELEKFGRIYDLDLITKCMLGRLKIIPTTLKKLRELC